MSLPDQIVDCLADWASSQNSDRISEYYLFGSSIYQDGVQFDHDKYHSDIDVVVRFKPSLSPLERRDAIIDFKERKHDLEVRLLPVLRSTKIDTPIVSVIPISPFELSCDIHKTTLDGFFSTNHFLNLRSRVKASFDREFEIDVNRRERFLLPAIQACQEFRNRFLAITANKLPAVPPHNGADVIPKRLARVAAAVAHYVKPRPDVSEHDINEGTTFLFSLVDEAESTAADVWGTLRKLIQQRMARGNPTIAAEDILLLYELLDEQAIVLLKDAISSQLPADNGSEGMSSTNQETGLFFSGSHNDGKRVKVHINLPQESIPAGQIEEIVGATRDFFRALGFDQTSENDPEFGSFFQELVFTSAARVVAVAAAKDVWTFLSERLRSRRERTIDASKIDERSISHRQAEATARLVESLDSFENAVVRMGDVVLVKATVADDRRLIIQTLSPEQSKKINETPDILKSADRMIEFLGDSKSEVASSDGV